jgi:hypothetical protein
MVTRLGRQSNLVFLNEDSLGRLSFVGLAFHIAHTDHTVVVAIITAFIGPSGNDVALLTTIVPL